MSGKVCYNNLFKLLIDKGLKKSELARMCNLSSPTMAKLSKNEYVSMDVLVRICQELDCTFDDIVEIVRKESNDYEINQ
ncbi:helix-turn-helix domain-containing protein [[Clostridium] innocuum]|uniref:helix-turn-helix domain-containing protein n=1 Tax=Clostridium innocuum TaxID=1522 RepID=UPI001C38C172|nr:helix-turn-helix transcriptional regulator [[Clostridium] innocuum]MBV4169486.1 helix-turn-helix transcriptional regulator [[Clostridium] innocuum]